MPGVKGMKHTRARRTTARHKMWQSMIIKPRFDIPYICITSGAGHEHAKKYVRMLERHGIIARLPGGANGQPGVFNAYRLVRNSGPDHPVRCDRCGRPLGQPCEEVTHE